MAFDRRFVSFAVFRSNPLFVLLIYAPSALFGTVALVQLIRSRIWPAAAFSGGLIGTGIIHQAVADQSYGNPGYMVPIGHLAAPVASLVAYSACFLIAWLAVKVSRYGMRLRKGDE